MDKPATIINPAEVKYLSGVNKNIPACSFSSVQQVEKRERRNCLGKTFYDSLLADVVDYSGANEYDSATAYVLDDVVIYKGIYYKATGATTGNAPSDYTKWEYAPKFSEAAYNTLWTEYLGMYLALNVLEFTLTGANVDFSDQGLIQHKGETFQQASESSIKRFQMGVTSRISTVLANMTEFLQEEAEGEPLYQTFKGVEVNFDCNDGLTGGSVNSCDCGGDLVGQIFMSDGSIRTYGAGHYCGRSSCSTCNQRKIGKNGGYEVA